MAAMTVGELARRAGTTPRALRHYDRLGLFQPDHVDAETGVRFYTDHQLPDLLLVVSLRALDLPLDEVRRCLAAPPGAERDRTVQNRLAAHRRRLEARRTRVERALIRLDMTMKGNPMGTENLPATDHRALASALFNRAWTLMEKEDRSPAEDDLLVHTAHASAYHWRQVGNAANFARSEWQVSRVYTVLGRADPASQHARRCLQICQENGIGDWDLAFAYEALARAAAVAGDREATREWGRQAYEAASDIKDDEDRELVLSDLATITGTTAPA